MGSEPSDPGSPESDEQDWSLDTACQYVGRFLYLFAKVEGELDYGISVLFQLEPDEAAILSPNIDFSRKLSILRSAALDQKVGPDEKTISDSPAKKLINESFNRALTINNDRLIVAHSGFSPDGQGVRFARSTAKFGLERVNPRWGKTDFEKKYAFMSETEAIIITLNGNLQSYDPKLDPKSLLFSPPPYFILAG